MSESEYVIGLAARAAALDERAEHLLELARASFDDEEAFRFAREARDCRVSAAALRMA